MKAEQAVRRLLTAIPESETWERVRGEAYGPQGIVSGADVRRVLYCVTIGPAVEDYWRQGGYDLLVAHHPFRPRSPIPNVVLHTALDSVPGGLNDLWRDALGLEEARPITGNLGWVGRVPKVPFEKLVTRIRDFAGGIEGQVVSAKKSVSSVAICTGLGGFVADEAAATGADVYVTGELTQWAADVGMPAVIEVGHTRSETVGVATIQAVLGPGIQVDAAPLEIDRWAGEVFGGRRAA